MQHMPGAAPSMTGGQRALLGLVVLMGVLIVGGTTALVAIVVHRLANPHPSVAVGRSPAMPVPGGVAGMLAAGAAEPAGTRIVSLSRQSDTVLAIALTGGGPDRVLLWDLGAGRAIGEIRLGPPPG